MSSTYNGLRAIASSTTVGATHTSTIVTVGSHDLAPGDAIFIFGASEGQLNGLQLVNTTPLSNTLTIINSAFADGSGGAGGDIVVYTGGESLTIPSDGDGPGIKAADVDGPFEGLQDAVAYLQTTHSSYQLVKMALTSKPSVSDSITTLGPLETLNAFPVDGQIGDVVETHISSSIQIQNTGAALAEVQLSIVEFVAASVISGASAALATAVTNIAASTDSNYVFPFTLVGFTTLAKAGAYECQLYGQIVTSSGTVAATLTPTLIAIQKLWRPC